MRRFIFLIVVLLIGLQGISRLKDSTVHYNLPDSVKAVQFIAEIKVTSLTAKYFLAGINTSAGTLRMTDSKGKRKISFLTHRLTPKIVVGNGVEAAKDIKYSHYDFDYNWQLNKAYKLLIAIAADSAAGFFLTSAYFFLPEENKWKIIGTSRLSGNVTLSGVQTFFAHSKKGSAEVSASNTWIQRSNGFWKNLKEENTPPPVINLYSHVDSLTQRDIEIKQIQDSIATGKASNLNQHNGIYYSMIKEGNGRQVSVTDTVVAYYKGYLFANGQVFDQTKDKPATFPLSRLIKGWQIGLPLCKVGGKIRLVIPSDLGYSIRTRAAKIPPNSILVFEIEVVDLKPLQ